VRAIQNGDSKTDIRKRLLTIITQMVAIVFIEAALIYTMNENFPDAF
jgi:hypothetical protein